MYYLLYLSTPNGLLDVSDYVSILKAAKANNQNMGISGMLLATDAYFLQLLEGEENKVRQLYKHIAKDKRHHDLFVLDEGTASCRYFAEWEMGFDYMGWMDKRKVEGLSPVLKCDTWAWSPEELRHRPIYLLDQFRKQFRSASIKEN